MSDELLRVYSRIYAIRQEASEDWVPHKLCIDFDVMLTKVESITGDTLAEFKIGDAGRDRQGNLHKANFVRPQMDGYLNYLRAKLPPEQVSRIGFLP